MISNFNSIMGVSHAASPIVRFTRPSQFTIFAAGSTPFITFHRHKLS